MATMQTWQAAAAFFSAQLLAASLPQVPNHQASKTCSHLGRGHVEPGSIPRATNATNPAGGGSVEQRRCFGVGRILSCWLLSGDGMSGKGQPRSCRGLLTLQQVVKLEQETGALQTDLLLWVRQKSQGQLCLCVGRFNLYNLPLLGLWMGFSVAPKELQCLNPVVILPFKLIVAVSLPPQHSGNPPSQSVIAVMWRKGRDLQVHMLAHRLECHLLKWWLVRNNTKAWMKSRTWRFCILPLMHVSYQCVLGKLVSQPILWT